MEPFMLAYILAVLFFASGIGLMIYAGVHDPEHPRTHPHADPH